MGEREKEGVYIVLAIVSMSISFHHLKFPIKIIVKHVQNNNYPIFSDEYIVE